MDIQIDSRALGRALRMTAAVAKGTATMPVLGNVLLRSDGKTLTVTGTNLEISTIVRCAAEGMAGDTCVDAKKFAELSKHIPAGVVRLSKTADGKQMEVAFGRSRFAFLTMDSAEFPRVPDVGDDGVDLKRLDLLELLKGTLYAASRDETRPNISCVRLERNKHVNGLLVVAVATDGHRLSVVERYGEGITKDVSIDRNGAAEMVRAIEDCTDEEVRLRVTDKDATLVAGDVTISCRLVDIKYPAWSQVVPETWGTAVTLSRADLAQALAQVMCMADEHHRVTIEAKDGTLTLSSAKSGVGECVASAPTSSDVTMKTAVNGAYLVDAIRHVVGDDITIACSDPLSPVGVWGQGRHAELAVVMPIR